MSRNFSACDFLGTSLIGKSLEELEADCIHINRGRLWEKDADFRGRTVEVLLALAEKNIQAQQRRALASEQKARRKLALAEQVLQEKEYKYEELRISATDNCRDNNNVKKRNNSISEDLRSAEEIAKRAYTIALNAWKKTKKLVSASETGILVVSGWKTSFDHDGDTSAAALSTLYKQTDRRGKLRLHGAFGGGWSAGHFNTVADEEGFQCGTFVSSRSERAEITQQRREDFGDKEDNLLAQIDRKQRGSGASFGKTFSAEEKRLVGPRSLRQDSAVPLNEEQPISIRRWNLQRLLVANNNSLGGRMRGQIFEGYSLAVENFGDEKFGDRAKPPHSSRLNKDKILLDAHIGAKFDEKTKECDVTGLNLPEAKRIKIGPQLPRHLDILRRRVAETLRRNASQVSLIGDKCNEERPAEKIPVALSTDLKNMPVECSQKYECITVVQNDKSVCGNISDSQNREQRKNRCLELMDLALRKDAAYEGINDSFRERIIRLQPLTPLKSAFVCFKGINCTQNISDCIGKKPECVTGASAGQNIQNFSSFRLAQMDNLKKISSDEDPDMLVFEGSYFDDGSFKNNLCEFKENANVKNSDDEGEALLRKLEVEGVTLVGLDEANNSHGLHKKLGHFFGSPFYLEDDMKIPLPSCPVGFRGLHQQKLDAQAEALYFAWMESANMLSNAGVKGRKGRGFKDRGAGMFSLNLPDVQESDEWRREMVALTSAIPQQVPIRVPDMPLEMQQPLWNSVDSGSRQALLERLVGKRKWLKEGDPEAGEAERNQPHWLREHQKQMLRRNHRQKIYEQVLQCERSIENLENSFVHHQGTHKRFDAYCKARRGWEDSTNSPRTVVREVSQLSTDDDFQGQKYITPVDSKGQCDKELKEDITFIGGERKAPKEQNLSVDGNVSSVRNTEAEGQVNTDDRVETAVERFDNGEKTEQFLDVNFNEVDKSKPKLPFPQILRFAHCLPTPPSFNELYGLEECERKTTETTGIQNMEINISGFETLEGINKHTTHDKETDAENALDGGKFHSEMRHLHGFGVLGEDKIKAAYDFASQISEKTEANDVGCFTRFCKGPAEERLFEKIWLKIKRVQNALENHRENLSVLDMDAVDELGIMNKSEKNDSLPAQAGEVKTCEIYMQKPASDMHGTSGGHHFFGLSNSGAFVAPDRHALFDAKPTNVVENKDLNFEKQRDDQGQMLTGSVPIKKILPLLKGRRTSSVFLPSPYLCRLMGVSEPWKGMSEVEASKALREVRPKDILEIKCTLKNEKIRILDSTGYKGDKEGIFMNIKFDSNFETKEEIPEVDKVLPVAVPQLYKTIFDSDDSE